MAEIKTCEQYVLAELEQAKWDIDSLKAINARLDDLVGELRDKLNTAVKQLENLQTMLNDMHDDEGAYFLSAHPFDDAKLTKQYLDAFIKEDINGRYIGSEV